jgi:hypothetical protein
LAGGGCAIETRRRDSWGVIIGAIALIFASVLIGQSGVGRDLWAPPGSTYGEDDDALSAIYAVLDDRGGALRLDRPPGQIPAKVDRLVLWNGDEVTEEEWAALKDWVAAGHTLLVAGESPEMPERESFGLRTQETETARPAAVHPALVGVQTVATGEGRFKPLDRPALVLLSDAAGSPVLISEPHGSGQILWSADTDWLTNGTIEQANNLELALGLLRPAPGKVVAFDEYHHGYTAAEHWWQILRGPLQLFVLQLGAALLLFFWAAGSRFGRPRPEPLLPARAAVEYVGAMSHLYRRARARDLVRRALYGSLLRSLGGLLGGVRGLTHAQMAERTAARTGLDAGLIERTLSDLSGETVPAEATLLSLARQVAELQRSVRHAGFRDQQRAAKEHRAK